MSYLVQENEITVNYAEIEGWPKENCRWNGKEATRLLKCAWADRIQLARELVGYGQLSGFDIIYHRAHRYAPFKEIGDDAIALDVAIAPFAGSVPDPTSVKDAEYRYAYLTVKYGIPDYDLPTEGQTYVTESLEPASEFLTLPHEKLFWQINPTKVPLESTEAPAKIIRMLAWVYTLNDLSSLPNEVYDLPGCVNKNDVYSWSLKRWFAWETLLCSDPSLRREGTSKWSATFRFLYRNAGTFANPLGWNVFPRPSEANDQGQIAYSPVKTEDGDDVLIYTPTNFEGLII